MRYENEEGSACLYNSQSLKNWRYIREFEKDGSVRNTLVVEQEADPPDNRREAHVLGAGQVVQDNLGLGGLWGDHVGLLGLF